jgi:hypothetical protein
MILNMLMLMAEDWFAMSVLARCVVTFGVGSARGAFLTPVANYTMIYSAEHRVAIAVTKVNIVPCVVGCARRAWHTDAARRPFILTAHLCKLADKVQLCPLRKHQTGSQADEAYENYPLPCEHVI